MPGKCFSPHLLCAALWLLTAVPGRATCWQCVHDGWDAATTYRSIGAPLRFECGCGICGDNCSPLHTPGKSWVDFVGGISSECDDHSDSFRGPYDGEWSGCSGFSQSASDWRWIDSVSDPNWDRWPLRWRPASYEVDDIGFLLESDTMRDPFGTVYDLDQCWDIDPIGTVYWGNFPVQSQLIAGSTTPEQGYAIFHLEGHADVTCGPWEGNCRSVICSDLYVMGTFRCTVVGDSCGSPEPHPDPPPVP